jgi:ectoine hydroxylase-related dioxygenase (phytanoyl-CoA dioxygenase family)
MFINSTYQDAMKRLGCCVVPLLSQKSVDALLALHGQSFSSPSGEGLVANHNSTPAEQALHVSHQIEHIVGNELSELFKDYTFFVGHFMVKQARTLDEFPLHQDWNIVHEATYGSYQIWIPLQLTDSSNGGMFYVPESHALFNNYRSGSFNISRIPTDDAIAPWIQHAIVPTGKAFVYSNALFHASCPNQSSQDRISVILNIVAKDAPTYYFHHLAQQEKAACYTITNQTLLQHLPALEQGLVPFSEPPHHTEDIPGHINNRALASEALAQAIRTKRAQERNQQSTLMFPVLKSIELENEVVQNGFAVLPFLSDAQVERARELWNTSWEGESNGIYTTLMSLESTNRKAIHRALINIMQANLEALFQNHHIPICQFFVKHPNPNGAIGLHTDSTLLLNPQLEPHYAIWIPLQDVDAQNGTLMVVPESHNWNNGIAAASVSWPFVSKMEAILPKAVPLKLKAGQLVLFDNRLLHGSTINQSANSRLCIAGRVTHLLSSYYSFWKRENDDRIGVYAEDQNIYLSEEWAGDRKQHSDGDYLGSIAQNN